MAITMVTPARAIQLKAPVFYATLGLVNCRHEALQLYGSRSQLVPDARAASTVVLALAITRAVKTGEWGVGRAAFLPALRAATVLTL